MLLFNLHDYQKFAISICKFVEDHESFKEMDERPLCEGKTPGV